MALGLLFLDQLHLSRPEERLVSLSQFRAVGNRRFECANLQLKALYVCY